MTEWGASSVVYDLLGLPYCMIFDNFRRVCTTCLGHGRDHVAYHGPNHGHSGPNPVRDLRHDCSHVIDGLYCAIADSFCPGLLYLVFRFRCGYDHAQYCQFSIKKKSNFVIMVMAKCIEPGDFTLNYKYFLENKM